MAVTTLSADCVEGPAEPHQLMSLHCQQHTVSEAEAETAQNTSSTHVHVKVFGFSSC